MFKLESYITPWLLGYLDKYVKLKPEDFQLSLWGGDIVLNKLELRTNKLERMIHLPVTFVSGQIHELRIHVPWTRLGSEPVVVTINTMECILKIKDSTPEEASSMKSSASSKQLAQKKAKIKAKQLQEAEALPPGYLQSILNRIINNVNIVINNLILKFVEDDIVLSVNVKSAEVYSVDGDWLRAFVDLAQPDLVLRRVINFHDLTACLDKRNASGKIETYQDPLVYRCSVMCRIHMTYDSLHAKIPTTTMLHIMCEKLDFSLTDTQLPMFLRLIELVLALYYGTLELPSGPSGSADENRENSETESQADMSGVQNETSQETPPEGSAEESWSSWAWSWVAPATATEEEAKEEEEELNLKKKKDLLVLSLGGYIKKASLVFKLTDTVTESPYYGPQKVVFTPLMCLETESISVELLVKGLIFFDMQFGITAARIISLGECVCGRVDTENGQDPCFLETGNSSLDGKLVNFISNSLFDTHSPENRGEKSEFLFDREKHKKKFTEGYATQRFGAFWMDYLYTMEERDSHRRTSHHSSRASSASSSSTHLTQHTDDNYKELSSMKFLFGTGQLVVSSSMVHRIRKFLHCAYDHEYEPYSKPKPEVVDENRPHPTEHQVALMEEFIATQSYHVTLQNTTILYMGADHNDCDIAKKRVTTPRKARKSSTKQKSAPKLCILPVLKFQAQRFDYQINRPMYARRVVKLVSAMAASNHLLDHCHSHTTVKVFGAQMGLSCWDPHQQVAQTTFNLVQPWSGAYYRKTLLLNPYWKDLHQVRWQSTWELPSITLNGTKAQLLLALHHLASWKVDKPEPRKLLQTSLMDDVFSRHGSLPVLEICVNGVEWKRCSTSSDRAASGILGSIYAAVLTREKGKKEEISPVLSGPVDTSGLYTPSFFATEEAQKGGQVEMRHTEGGLSSSVDCITFTWQTPKDVATPLAPSVFLANVQGIVCTVDPVLHDWIIYEPNTKQEEEEPKVVIDSMLAHATVPLKETGSGKSSSTVTIPSGTPSRSQTTTTNTKPVDVDKEQKRGEEEGEEKRETGLKAWLSRMYHDVKIMEVQVDISSSCIFFPSRHLVFMDPTANLHTDLRLLYQGAVGVPDTLVVSLPSVHLCSMGHKAIEAVQEIPIKFLQQSIAGEKLPWNIQVSNFSIYSIHPGKVSLPLVKPSGLSTTIAVTSKYNPPSSEHLSSLSLCVHADMGAVHAGCSQKQVQLLAQLTGQLLSMSDSVLSSVTSVNNTLGSKTTPSSQPHPEIPGAVYPGGELPVGQRSDPSGSPQPKGFRSDPSSSLMDTGESLLTDTSDGLLSRDPTPVRETDQGGTLRLSLWLQWTLPKLTTKLYGVDKAGKDLCISLEVEDLTTSIDIQEVYSKVNSKVGAICMSHLTRSTGGEWTPGPFEGIILTCQDQLTKKVDVITNKLWSSSNQPIVSLYGLNELKPRDKSHVFASITFTRALSKSVQHKLRRMNSEVNMDGTQGQGQGGGQGEGRMYLNEVCLNVQPCDIVLYCPVILSAINMILPSSQSPRGTEAGSRSKGSRSNVIVISGSALPLAYLNISNFRLFVPSCTSQADISQVTSSQMSTTHGTPSQMSSGLSQSDHQSSLATIPREQMSCPRVCSTLDHDVCIVQLETVTLKPHADNPLPRLVVDKERYHQALQSHSTHQLGGELEDRQFQMDISGMAVMTGCWKDLIAKSRSRSGSLEEKEERIQNPALEWNQLLQRDEESEVKVFPLCASCDLRIVLAPAIVETSVTKSNIVCGYSAEVNVTSDMDFYLSTNQVGLFWDIFTTNITSGTVKQQCQKDRGHHATREAISKAKSSEISETQSTISDGTTQRAEATSSQRFSSQEKGVNPLKGVTPFDILLTAGRISFTCYSHRVAKDHCRKDSTLENLLSQIKASGHSATRKRSDLEEPLDKMEEDKSAESFCSFERSESVYYTPQNSMSEAIHEENLDQDNGGQAGQLDEGVIDTVPYFYAYFSQPHSVASCHPDRQKLEMSCYDVTLKGAKSGYILEDPFKMLPDLGDFTAHWVETRAGETDPKTGIPPSLYTFKAENFLTGKAGLTVSIERPLKLNLSLVLLEQVKELVQETLEQLRQREETTVAAGQSSETVQQTTGEKELTTDSDSDPAESTEKASGSVPAYVRYLGAIRNIKIGTVQLVVAMTTVPHEEHAGILMALSQFQAGIELEADEGALSVVSISAWLSNILVKTRYQTTVRPLLGPLSTSMDAQLQWILHSGPRWLPQVCASVECGPVQICVGQEHALCMLTLAKHWSIYNKILQQTTSVHTKSGSTRERRREKTKKTRKNDQGVSSVDDLRTGAFQYVFTNDTPDVTPEAGEIVFGSDEEEDVAFMAWCYPEARLLTKVHITPVPFSTSQLSLTGKVDCVLQYWCILNKNYIDYQQFQITEGNDCQVELPGLQDKPTVAQVWRVLIYHGDREERSQSESPDPVVSPMTLAASMRVDSCILPALVPAVRFQCTASLLVMRMSNHFQHLGKATPSKLCPFYLDNCSPSDQDVLTITVDDPSFDMSIWMDETLQTTGQVTGIGQCDIVEYRNLTTQTLVDPVAASASLQYTLGTESTLECDVKIDPVYLHIGQSTVHTLGVMVQTWAQLQQTAQAEKVIVNYYMICNDTLSTIRFGQVGSDENISLQSREMHAYSWRSHKKQQVLQVCLEGKNMKWCDPFEIEKPGTVIRTIDHKGHKVTFLIKVKVISGLQRQVIISGQLVIANRLTQHLEVKVLQQQLTKETPHILGAKQTLPSLVMERSEITGVKVRLMGPKMAWSTDIEVTGEGMKENKMVKLSTSDKNGSLHVWCSVLVKSYGDVTQTVVLFTPLFVLRAHLPSQLIVNVDTPRMKSMQQLLLPGHGVEQQLQCVGGDVTHMLTFQQGDCMKPSSPPLSLSAGMTDQVTHQSVDTLDIEKECYSWDTESNTHWPYTDKDFSPNIPDSRQSEPYSHPTPTPQATTPTLTPTLGGDLSQPHPNIDLQVHLSQRWPGCNTLLLDITPWSLVVNRAGMSVAIVDSSSEKVWVIRSGEMMAPPPLEGGFRLGVTQNSAIYSSNILVLSDEAEEDRGYLPRVEGVVYKGGVTNVSIIVDDQVHYLTLTSDVHHHMRVLTIQETYQLVNQSQLDLMVLCAEVPFGQNKYTSLSLDHSKAVSVSRSSSGQPGLRPLSPWTRLDPDTQAKDHAKYLLFKLHCEEISSVEQESSPFKTDTHRFMWSVPLRVKVGESGSRLPESGSRSTCTFPFYSEGAWQSCACVVTHHVKKGVTYIVIQDDPAPSILLHNNTDTVLYFGQGCLTPEMKGVTVHEEQEQFQELPLAPPHGRVHYTFPEISASFPAIGQNKGKHLKLHLAVESGAQNTMLWSQGIDLESTRESFVHIPASKDVKVHVEHKGHTVQVFVNTVSRAEVSAKEIRSRITQQTTTVIMETGKEEKRASSESFHLVPVDVTEEGKTNAGEVATNEDRDSPGLHIETAVMCKLVCCILSDDVTNPRKSTEVLRITADDIFIAYYPIGVTQVPPSGERTFAVCVGNLQVDNQMYNTGNYHFPVVLQKQASFKGCHLGVEFEQLLTVEKLTYMKPNCLVMVDLTLYQQDGSLMVEKVNVAMKPMSLYIEDTFVYDMLKKIDTFIPVPLSKKNLPTKHLIPRSVLAEAMCISQPIRLRLLSIQPMSLQLSVHASLKLFLSSDNTPLNFGHFDVDNLHTTSRTLIRTLAMHYATGALFRAGWVVGSLELLGNPTGLVRSIGTGVADLFRMPYAGLSRGPGAFVGGVTQGMGSLLANVTAGTLSSITSFASSVSRNMDRLSLDTDHSERQEHSRRHHPVGVSSGLKQGFTGFGLSLLGAIAGIADQPIQSLTTITQTPTSPAQKATGIVSGVGKGLMGIVTKPIGGAAEFVSQTGQGLLQGTGLSRLPEPRYSPTVRLAEDWPNAYLKFVSKLLNTLPSVELVMELPATQHISSIDGAPITLLLTSEILFIMSVEEDLQQQAFAVSEISVRQSSRNPWMLYLNVQDLDGGNVEEEATHTTQDRIAEFIHGYPSQTQHRDSVSVSDNQSEVSNPSPKKLIQHRFQADPKLTELFVGLFQLAKDKLLGKGFQL